MDFEYKIKEINIIFYEWKMNKYENYIYLYDFVGRLESSYSFKERYGSMVVNYNFKSNLKVFFIMFFNKGR